jgi:hypothetical protein
MIWAGLMAISATLALAVYLFGRPRTASSLAGYIMFGLVLGYVSLGCYFLFTVH